MSTAEAPIGQGSAAAPGSFPLDAGQRALFDALLALASPPFPVARPEGTEPATTYRPVEAPPSGGAG